MRRFFNETAQIWFFLNETNLVDDDMIFLRDHVVTLLKFTNVI